MRVVATILPGELKPERYRVRCLESGCSMARAERAAQDLTTSNSLDYVQRFAQAHASREQHAVVIEDWEAEEDLRKDGRGV